MSDLYSEILDEIKRLSQNVSKENIEVELKLLTIETRRNKKITMKDDFNLFYGYFYNISSSNFFTYSITYTKTLVRDQSSSISLRKTVQLKNDVKDSDEIFETTYIRKEKKIFDFEFEDNSYRLSVSSEIPITEKEYEDAKEPEHERKRQRYSFEFKIKNPDKSVTKPKVIKKHKVDLTVVDLKEFEFEVELYENFYSELFKPKLDTLLREINCLVTQPKYNEVKYTLSNPVNLKRDNLRSLVNYARTNKLDGQRKQMIFAENGIFLKDTTGYIKVSNLNIIKYRTYILDIEFYRGSIYAFDLVSKDGKYPDNRKFKDRYKDIEEIINFINTKDKRNKFNIKTFIFCSADESISFNIKKIKEMSKNFVNDGFIFVPIYKGYSNKETYKWKPPQQLTVDMMLN